MSSDNPKQVLFAAFAEVAKALAHEHRMAIAECLAQGERSVETLAERIGLSVANASQHLRMMRNAGVLTSRRDGKRVVYSLSDKAVIETLTGIRLIAEHHVAEVRAVVTSFFDERDSMEPVSRGELASRLDSGSVIVLDVRPEDEFAAGHLPNAINIPLRKLAQALRTLPKDKEIVAYCRGAYCVLAFEAVALLRGKGHAVRRLEDGFPEWQAAGLPVEVGLHKAN